MSNAQIVTLYENGVGVEEIAEQFSLTTEAVTIALADGSAKFRAEVKKNPELFTDDTLEAARMVMEQLLYCENENVRYRSAKFIINEKKGRHDIKSLKGLNINVNLINVQYQKAQEALKLAKAVKQEDVICQPTQQSVLQT